MKPLFKGAIAAICALSFLSATEPPAFAGSDKITSLSVKVSETKGEPGMIWEAEPVAGSKKYYMEDYSWSSDPDSWKPGSTVTLTVTLRSDDYTFDKDAKVSVSGATKSSAKRKDTHTFQVKANYTPKVILETPTGFSYDDDLELTWDSVEYAGGYEVKLAITQEVENKNGDTKEKTTKKTVKVEGKKNTELNLEQYVTDEDAEVTASIRAVGASGKKGITASEWAELGESISSEAESTVSGTFNKNSTFTDSATGETVEGWQMINDQWYYFDPDNKGKTAADSWKQINGFWYHFDSDGKMQNGWLQDADGNWYFLSQDTENPEYPYGAMKTGWIQNGPGGNWYYLSDGRTGGFPYGAMLKNCTTPDGYYVNSDGSWS